MMKQRIICDTNVWYGIALGNINNDQIAGLNLVLTENTLSELASTHNLYNNPQLVKDTIKAAISNASGGIELKSPFAILSSVFTENHTFSYDGAHYLLDELRFYSRMDDKHVSEEKVYTMKQFLDQKANEFDKTCSWINDDILPKIRANLADKKVRTAHKKKDFYQQTADFFCGLLSINDPELVFKETPDISSLDVLIKGTMAFYRKLELHPEQKFKPNDWYDMFNLAYLSDKNTLYWTYDNPWKDILTRSGLKHILYNP